MDAPPAEWLAGWSWSFTRHLLLRACPRSLYWRYLGSRGGYQRGAPPVAARAWALRALTSVPALIGTAVHDAADRIASAIRDGRPAPSYERLLTDGRTTLNRAWRRSQPDRIGRFWACPTAHPALQEILYRGALEQAEIEGALLKLSGCLRRLVAAPLFEDLANCRPEAVRLSGPGPERLAVDISRGDGHRAAATVWYAADLVYRHGEPGRIGQPARDRVGGPAWCVVDFKTGAPAPHDEALQLTVGALALAAWGYPPTDGVYLGRVIHLRGGTETWTAITAEDMAWARGIIAADAAAEYALHQAMVAGAPEDDPADILSRADSVREDRPGHLAYPLAADRRRCRECGFRALCTDEISPSEGQSS